MPTHDEKRLIDEAISRRGAMLADLQSFVDLPTGPGSGHEPIEALRLVLCDRAARLGAEVSLVASDVRPEWLFEGDSPLASHRARVPDTAICRREARGTGAGETRVSEQTSGAPLAGNPILLAGHLDTVHSIDSKFRRLVVTDDGRRATGPGCADMKGGLVIAIHALEVLEACGIRLPWTLLLNADEETGSFGSARTIRAEAKRIAIAGGMGLAVEPSLPDGTMVDERGGSGQFVLRARGKSAHVGRAFASGASAVVALAGAISRIARLAQPERGLIVNIGPLRGGPTTNSVPDLALAWGNIRFPDRKGADELLAKIREVCTHSDVAGTTLEAEAVVGRPGKPRSDDTRRLAGHVSSAAGVLGLSTSFGSTGGVCDGNLMQDEGLATLDTLGVVGGGLHTPDEWIDLSSMAERCAVLALTMLRASRGGTE